MKNILVIPFHDFKVSLRNGFATRDAHLYEHFMQSHNINNVIIINRPTSLAELLLRRKRVLTIKKLIYKNRFTYLQKYSSNVYIIDFFVFDFFNIIRKRHAWLPEIYSKPHIANKINNMLKYIGIEDYSIYMSSPLSVKLGINLKPKIKILDAVDNFAKYKNWSYFHKTIIELYDIAKKEYDYIIVNSQDTFNYLNHNIKAELVLISNGVDKELFKGKFDFPKDMPLGKKIVGYAGKMQRMFDTKLLKEIANEHKDVNFVILGVFLDRKWKKNNWDIDIKGLENVFYLGNKKYKELPSYYRNFDICFIPYFIANQHGGDPIKFYEYMACNKPIISTNIGNINKYNNGESIFICESQEDYIEKFRILINNTPQEIYHNLPNEILWINISKFFVDKMFN